MSMHNKPLTLLEELGLLAHGFGKDIGKPSMAADIFRHGMDWANMPVTEKCADLEKQLDHGIPLDEDLRQRMAELLNVLASQAQQESTLFSQSGKYDIENGRIVNAATRKPIPSHAPVFILIGNDLHARETIQFYRDKCEDVMQKTAVVAQLTAFVNYFNSYSHNIKQPDSELPPAPEGE